MLTRRHFFKTLLAATTAGRVFASSSAPPPPRPNIVLILADDLGFSDIGCYGSEIPTPALDRLAQGGVRFTQFYNTARCCPARASLLTGLYPHQAGIGHMADNASWSSAHFINRWYSGDLTHDSPTLAETLRTVGYRTAIIGKWHVTRHTSPEGDTSNWPLQRGFDTFYGTLNGAGSYFSPATLTRNNTPLPPPGDSFYYTDALGDSAAEHIRAASPAHPFFLYLAFTAPHWPLHAPDDEVERFKGRYDAGYEAIRDQRLEKQKRLGIIPAETIPAPLPGKWKGSCLV